MRRISGASLATDTAAGRPARPRTLRRLASPTPLFPACTIAAILAAAFTAALTAVPTDAQHPTMARPGLLAAIDHYTGVTGRVDDPLARRLLEEVAVDDNDVLSRMWIARVYSRGRMTFERDEERARMIASQVIDQVRLLASSGDVEALFLMGTAYDEGLGVDVDHEEALRWYRRAAHLGHVLAVHNVGNVYRDGRGVEVDHARAAMWWLRAARAGDVIPALRLGEAYEAGRGVPQDLNDARFWYDKAATAGNAQAMAALERLRR